MNYMSRKTGREDIIFTVALSLMTPFKVHKILYHVALLDNNLNRYLCHSMSTHLKVSHRSVVESSQPNFPASASPMHWTHWRCVWYFLNVFLINSYGPPGIPHKPDLVSFSDLNPCPSNSCHKGTMLVHLLVFWVSFLQVVQAKKGIHLIFRQ